MGNKDWNYFVVNISAGDDAPQEWIDLIKILKNYLDRDLADKLINKIELVAFVIKTSRIARWKIPEEHVEHSTKEECIRVAKKLSWLLLNSKSPNNAQLINQELSSKLKCNKKENCNLFCGHDGECKDEVVIKITKCPLCRKEIQLDDFSKDANKDPDSIQAGHLIPLSRQQKAHNAENIAWFHRRCNYITGEHTLEETIDDLKRIVMEHTQFRQ